MATGSARGRVALLTVAGVVIASASAIAVNYATDAQSSAWWWVAVVALTFAAAALAVVLLRAQGMGPPRSRDPGSVGVIHPRAAGQPRAPLLLHTALVLTAGTSLVLTTILWRAEQQSGVVPPPVRTPVPPVSAQPVNPDVRMHEVWPSSSENERLPVSPGTWVLTEFPVTEPWLRSVEVAAGPNDGRMALLQVYDDQGHELAQQEAPVTGFRTKAVFGKAVDVRAYLGGRLRLVVRNISDSDMSVYLTRSDRDPGTRAYRACGKGRPSTECPVSGGGDLSALVVGRASSQPW